MRFTFVVECSDKTNERCDSSDHLFKKFISIMIDIK